SMMGLEAAKRALESAQLDPKQLDLIIVATTTPEKVMPGAAFLIQDKLNLPGVPAFDICAACSGFIYGMSIADQYIRSGQMKR
ncbi:3-oxoacyl-ACP synthase, partial [Acinetobacter baumannii]